MRQVGGTLTMADAETCRVLVCDRDTKWSRPTSVRSEETSGERPGASSLPADAHNIKGDNENRVFGRHTIALHATTHMSSTLRLRNSNAPRGAPRVCVRGSWETLKWVRLLVVPGAAIMNNPRSNPQRDRTRIVTERLGGWYRRMAGDSGHFGITSRVDNRQCETR
jgi:hypothetical protein